MAGSRFVEVDQDLYTDYRVNISQRVKDGRTLLIVDQLEAVKIAAQMRSYCYQVFDHKRRPAGFAIPR